MSAPFWQGTSLHPETRPSPDSRRRRRQSGITRGTGITAELSAEGEEVVAKFIDQLNQHLDGVFGEPHRGLTYAHGARDPISLITNSAPTLDRMLATVRSSGPFRRVTDERWTFLVNKIKAHVQSFYTAVVTTDPYVSPFVAAAMFTEHLDETMLLSLTPKHLVDGGPTNSEREQARADAVAASVFEAGGIGTQVAPRVGHHPRTGVA